MEQLEEREDLRLQRQFRAKEVGCFSADETVQMDEAYLIFPPMSIPKEKKSMTYIASAGRLRVFGGMCERVLALQ